MGRCKSALVIDTPKNCYECPFGTEYCGNLEYEGCCELADCLDYDAILMTEEHYDYESESRPDWCPLKPFSGKNKAPKVAGGYELGYAKGYENGWIDCFNEITGE